jgi:predicted ATPase/DNA-binding winged helix-turn-helix (wHTH) protein
LSESLRFGRAEVRPRERQLLVEGAPASVGARAFDVLLALIERRDRLVTKNELLDVVWPGLVVEENNLQVQISTLRKVLGPQTIATVPGRGYRFSAALDGESALPGTESGASDQARPLPVRRSNLPEEMPMIYGRVDEMRALRELISTHRLVTVVGAGGIGKSRLGQTVASASIERYRDGAWLVELAGLSDPALLPNTVAGALDIDIAGPGTALDELLDGIASKSMLLVLDNCEHLFEAVARLVSAIRRRAPEVTVLLTSQEPLHMPEEQQFRLLPLALPSDTDAADPRRFGALTLFEARVRAVDPRFVLNDDAIPLAIDICRRLDGMPLAIELAAARVGTLGLRAVREKLDARFKLLTGGARTHLRRHQTLRAALEWSYGLLNDDERVVFRRLGAFAGSFTMELAQAVVADEALDEWAVLDHMSGLVDKSLVVADPGDPPRYRLLETARAFALEHLAADEMAQTLRRHALGMLALLRRVDDANLEGELRTDQYAAQTVPELDNLRAAYAWAISDDGDPQIAIALAAHAGSLIDYAVECAAWLMPHREQVEAGAVDLETTARYWRALAAGNMMTHVPLALAAEAAERARGLYKSLGKPRRMFASLMRLISYCQSQGDRVAAQAALAEARTLIKPEWPTEFHIYLLRRDAALAGADGRYAEAFALMRAEVKLSATTADWRLQVIARNNLVDLLWQRGDLEEAAAEAQKLAVDLRARPAAISDTDVLYANLMGIFSELNRLDEAAAAAREGLPFMRRSHSFFLEEWTYLFWRRGQLDTAALLLGAIDAASARSGRPPQANEQRLIVSARAGIESALDAETLAGYRATGVALDAERLAEVLSAALEQRASV